MSSTFGILKPPNSGFDDEICVPKAENFLRTLIPMCFYSIQIWIKKWWKITPPGLSSHSDRLPGPEVEREISWMFFSTLQGTNISPTKALFEDYVPFPHMRYVSPTL